jgi:peptide/nickel transport system permease protein
MAATTNNSSIVSLKAHDQAVEARSPLSLAWRRFRAHRMAIVGALVMLVIALYVLIGSFAFTEGFANQLNLRFKWNAPTAEHPMGTDAVGRDVMARTIYGGQISLAISILAVAVTTLSAQSWA